MGAGLDHNFGEIMENLGEKNDWLLICSMGIMDSKYITMIPWALLGLDVC